MLQGAGLAPAAQVAGTVHARTCYRAKRVGHKPICSQLWALEIAVCYAQATNANFPLTAHRHWLQGLVQHPHLGIVNGRADGNGMGGEVVYL